MTPNKQVMDKFLTLINTCSTDLANQVISENASFVVPGRSEPLRGPGGYLAVIEMMRSGFSDVQWALDEMVAEENKVAARFTMTGTHDGVFMGIPASGKNICVKASNFYTFKDGQIVEEYGQPDLLSLLQQIGAIPPAKLI